MEVSRAHVLSLLLILELAYTVCSELLSESHPWIVKSSPVHEKMFYFVRHLQHPHRSPTYRNQALRKANTSRLDGCIPAGTGQR